MWQIGWNINLEKTTKGFKGHDMVSFNWYGLWKDKCFKVLWTFKKKSIKDSQLA